MLVQAGIEEVLHRVNPGAALPPDTEVAELITMLVRFRTQAVSAVSATLAFSIESTIETTVGQILGEFIEKEPRPTRTPDHSHSMVPGGLLVMSSTTRLTSRTSLVMRVEMRSSTS